jgi:hypothetical protein
MKKSTCLLLVPILLAALVACDKQMQEMNTDPLALSQLPDEYLFTTAVRQAFGDGGYLSSTHLRFTCQYDHMYVTNNEDRAADGYQDFHTQDIYKEMYARAYTGALRYINEVLLITGEGERADPVRHAMADIVAVIDWAQTTDCWGDIPYFEGAAGSSGILYPKYDSQQAIYNDLLDRLKSSLEVLQSANPGDGYPGADPAYANDLQKWAVLANSMRFRLAMKIRFADPETAARVVSECMEKPLMESNEQNFKLTHQESDNSEIYNPWFDIRKYNNFKMGQKLVDWLKNTHDPRLTILVEPNKNGVRQGVPNGLTDQAFSLVDWNSYSNPMPVLYSKSLTQYLMCASEVWFLRAEAALFDLAPGDANALYREGIRTNLELWQVDPDSIQVFLDQEEEATLNGSQEKRFRQIGTQMWIAFIPNFTEAWTNIRRTGYPEIPQRTDPSIYSMGVTDGYLPKRFKYASSEYLNNLANVNDAISRQGPDKIDTPIWWDVRGN